MSSKVQGRTYMPNMDTFQGSYAHERGQAKKVHYHNVCFHLYKLLEHAYSSIMKKGSSVTTELGHGPGDGWVTKETFWDIEYIDYPDCGDGFFRCIRMSKHQIVHSKYMQFTLHQLYFNKTESKQTRICALLSTHTTPKMLCLHFRLSRAVFS